MGIYKSKYMELAIEEALLAGERGEVPIGAVVVLKEGKVLARDGNRVIELFDPTAHAEILVLKYAAQKLGNERLINCDLYVTLEPCPMCASAISLSRIRRLYYGAEDQKSGGVDNGARVYEASSCHHRPEVYGGIGESKSANLLRKFFKERR
ncbi:MAG: nucleoside deaminase [Sphingomonadales bacterium]|jgi:tRNA(adenine34) deaminase|tara:strand:- start:34 stop:489 length:456 start_codon:yes stop_codon:yes gene_type:complete